MRTVARTHFPDVTTNCPIQGHESQIQPCVRAVRRSVVTRTRIGETSTKFVIPRRSAVKDAAEQGDPGRTAKVEPVHGTERTGRVRTVKRSRVQMHPSGTRRAEGTDRTRGAAAAATVVTCDSPRGPAPKHTRPASPIYNTENRRRRTAFHSQRERHWQCREVTAQHSFTASPGPAGSKESDETSR